MPGDKSNDGKVFDANVLIGGNFANGKGNATAYFGYKKEYELLQSERDFSACTIAAGNGVWTCGGSGTNATGRFSGFGKGVFTTDASGTPRTFSNALDQYNFGPVNHFQRPSERYNANATANYDFLPDVKIYSEFGFTDYHTIAQIAPGGAFGTVATIGFDNPLLTPAWKTTLGLTQAGDTTDVVIQRRNVEGGGRQSDFRNTSFRTVVGVKGDIGNWSYDAFMQTAKVIYSQKTLNYFVNDRIARSLDVVSVNGVPTCRSVVDGSDPACVPYNVWKTGGVTPASLAYLQAPGIYTGSTEQMVQGGSISSDLGTYGLRMPTSKNGIAVALGVERRTEKLNLDTDALVQSNGLSGAGGATPPLNGKFTVKDIYGEVRVPLVEGAPMADLLSANASYRHSDYDTGVKTNTYGVGIEWSPVKQVRFRGSYQKAVRAANLIELFTAQGNNLFDMNEDPCAGATPTATLAQCQRTGVTAAQYGNVQDSPAGQYNFLQGGNARLQPEKSDSNTLGLVFTPMSNMSATVDYFDIKVKETIGILNPVTTLNQCIATGAAQYCSLITRDRLGTLWLLDEGRIVGTNVNIGGSRASGLDLGFNYTHKLPAYGSLNLNVLSTYLLKAETEEIKGEGIYDCVGLFGFRCGTPNPEWRSKARATWSTPWNWDLALTWRFFGAVDLDATSSNPLLADSSNPLGRTLSARNYFDIAGSWALTKQITLRAGINNLFDKDPPITDQTGPSNFGNGNTFPQVYDALGRRVFFNLNAKF
ncbi:MAG: TonB-dependent receptor [Betaproteobacteria bacterium]